MNRVLVLGGGGLWGAFQAGAWSIIEKRLEIHGVIGTSAGALNGCCIAGGMPAGELEDLWRSAAPSARLRFRFPRRWSDGVLDTAPLEQTVRNLVRHWPPKIPFGVTVSQGPRLGQRLLRVDRGESDPILASCAIPFALPAKLVGQRLSFDGGLRDACPAWMAREFGAKHVLAVNVWCHLPWWWPRGKPDRPRLFPEFDWIEPMQPLGPLRSSIFWDSGNIDRWIRLGRQAAEDFFARQ